MTMHIIELINNKNFSQIKNELADMQEADIAEIINELDNKESLLMFRLLNKEMAAEVFSHLSPNKRSEISVQIRENELKAILEDLYFDDMIDYLEEMPASFVKRILNTTGEVKRKLINQFLNYPDNSAGSIMTIEYVRLKSGMTVEAAMNHIRKTARDKETVYTCYVTNKNRELEGIVSLKDLVLAQPDHLIRDIMNSSNIIYVTTMSDQEEVAELFKKYDLLAVPVVDGENRLVGIITIDDIVDVIDQENTEDFYKMAAIQPSEVGYLSERVLTLARKRILWLLILMISATISGNIIKRYDDLLQSMVILAVFIPRLMDTGGNAGSQSSTIVIRSIALGEIRTRDIFRVLWKEIKVSTIVGIALGAFNFIQMLMFGYGDLWLALAVSLAIFITVITAKVIGGALPLVARVIGIDPALMASPLITTIADAVALICYFAIATRLIG
ncbi:MAG: magnesium transporter [Clostridia bacterium]|jgi:magnesium transporter